MKTFVISVFALIALTQARPQVQFTAKEYEALQQVLQDRIPVAVQSAVRVLATSESNPRDFVVLNFDGLTPSVSARTGAVSNNEAGVAVARTGSAATDDDVAELFSEVAGDAVEDVEDAAEDAAEDDDDDEQIAESRTSDVGISENLINPIEEAITTSDVQRSTEVTTMVAKTGDETTASSVDTSVTTIEQVTELVQLTTQEVVVVENETQGSTTTGEPIVQESTVSTVAQETPAEETTVSTTNTTPTSTTSVATPTATASVSTTSNVAQSTEAVAAGRTGLAAEADDEAEDAVVAVENSLTPAQIVSAAIESARRKRQNESRQRQANTLSTALALLGLQVVPRS